MRDVWSGFLYNLDKRIRGITRNGHHSIDFTLGPTQKCIPLGSTWAEADFMHRKSFTFFSYRGWRLWDNGFSMIWPRHGRLSNCCSVSFRRAQRNLLNSRLQSKLFCCSHPRRWRKVRYIFTKSLILSTHVLFWFLFFVERTCLWGAYNMCFKLLQYSFNKPETRSPQDCDQLTENPIFFRQSNNQLDSSKNYSYYTL